MARIPQLGYGSGKSATGDRLNRMDVIDQLYEAAWAPEQWPEALRAMCAPSRSTQAVMLVFPAGSDPVATGYNIPPQTDRDFISERWKRSPAVTWALQNGHAEFTPFTAAFTASELAADPAVSQLYDLGLGDCLTSMLSLGDGDMAGFMVARARELGDYDPVEAAGLDALRPHLVRSVMVAARLRLEMARSMVDALGRLGLPAAVIDRRGRVVASNGLLDRIPGALIPTAFGGLALADRLKNDRLKLVLARIGLGEDGPATSIPIAGAADCPPVLIHLLPVRGRGRDLFGDGHIVLVASPTRPRALPRPDVLRALFDLSPAEARLVGELACGGSLPLVARRLGLSVHTVRVQLRAVMSKTGVHRQAELMRLVSSL
ncbi:helix-turn-helix transcriptional regulator [Brevundimonas sp. S30B]|uniref:helix-turn-helix transcriptional regulator n=1 Tax=unclassified Brevundimonas TaxID=2622653 RepID=UPI001072D0D0|nr:MULTISPECIES: helix-turn-helix transcriptional regulator [unclassified Brevundimonas]QBX38085.1 helix-turn-helix transcriptional regulator [Brevundimonas sp. MF30-B]TFW02561.1 helix-turn-helix transcriptional regulator [Brevundimonas sp. S30B]